MGVRYKLASSTVRIDRRLSCTHARSRCKSDIKSEMRAKVNGRNAPHRPHRTFFLTSFPIRANYRERPASTETKIKAPSAPPPARGKNSGDDSTSAGGEGGERAIRGTAATSAGTIWPVAFLDRGSQSAGSASAPRAPDGRPPPLHPDRPRCPWGIIYGAALAPAGHGH